MSADNWGVCPKCLKKIKERQIKLAKEVEEQYGKMPINEWISLKEKSDKGIPVEQETLREDFDIEMNKEGIFTISYSCRCDKCGFKHTYNYRVPLEI